MNTRQKKALYESIMKNVSKQVKKSLNEGMLCEQSGGLQITVNDPLIEVEADAFSHLMYGCDYYELDSFADNEEEAQDEISEQMKKFAKELNKAVKKLGISVVYYDRSASGDKILISGVTDKNFFGYLDALRQQDFGGELYFTDLLQFMPYADYDEDELAEYVKDWVW